MVNLHCCTALAWSSIKTVNWSNSYASKIMGVRWNFIQVRLVLKTDITPRWTCYLNSQLMNFDFYCRTSRVSADLGRSLRADRGQDDHQLRRRRHPDLGWAFADLQRLHCRGPKGWWRLHCWKLPNWVIAQAFKFVCFSKVGSRIKYSSRPLFDLHALGEN